MICHGALLPIQSLRSTRAVRLWKGAVALCAVAELNGSFDLGNAQIEATDFAKLPPGKADLIFAELVLTAPPTPEERAAFQTKIGMVDWACMKFGKSRGISGTESLGRWQLETQSASDRPTNGSSSNEDIVVKIEPLLPPQPWPASLRKTLAESSGYTKGQIFQALEVLQETDRWQRQRGACVLNRDGVIVAIDPARDDGRFAVGQNYKKP